MPSLMNTPYPIETLRHDFPILQRSIGKYPLVYLDNTATSQTPTSVLDTIRRVYTTSKANVHRGVHTLSQEATMLQERARERVARMLGGVQTREVIFTRGTTESLNLVASSLGDLLLEDGDEIILTVMEHHANIVPWQLLQRRKRFTIRVVPILPDGELDTEAYRRMFTPRTRIVSFCHASNVLGTVNPVRMMADIAHEHGCTVVVDGAQAVPHLEVDVRDLGADFYAFSSHKMYGPTGVGVLYGRAELLERMPPYQGGGEMISSVSFEGTRFADLPFKFEAGTPDFVGIAALHTAIDYLSGIGLKAIEEHEMALYRHALKLIDEAGLPVDIYGRARHKCAILSFNLRGAHAYDVGMLLDKQGVAVRTGHHCAQPLMHALGQEAVVRASFALYNTEGEVERFVGALQRTAQMLIG